MTGAVFGCEGKGREPGGHFLAEVKWGGKEQCIVMKEERRIRDFS